MKYGLAGAHFAAVALALAGILAAPLCGQVAPGTNNSMNGGQQSGVGQQGGGNQPASDLLTIVQLFTGGTDTWDYVIVESASLGSGSQGNGVGGSTNSNSVASRPAAQTVAATRATPSVASAAPNKVATSARVQAAQPAGQNANTVKPGPIIRPPPASPPPQPSPTMRPPAWQQPPRQPPPAWVPFIF